MAEDLREAALRYHREPKPGKIEVVSSKPLGNQRDLALAYTPFPATVCGYLCPNPCMQACTRQSAFMAPVDVTQLGQASIAATLPQLPPLSGSRGRPSRVR